MRKRKSSSASDTPMASDISHHRVTSCTSSLSANLKDKEQEVIQLKEQLSKLSKPVEQKYTTEKMFYEKNKQLLETQNSLKVNLENSEKIEKHLKEVVSNLIKNAEELKHQYNTLKTYHEKKMEDKETENSAE